MITIESLASSSKANCHFLSNGVTHLLLDAGLKIKKLRKQVTIQSITACLVTHLHGDHSCGVKDLLKAAIDCYMPEETARHLNVIGHHRVKIIKAGDHFLIHGWQIKAFKTHHDYNGMPVKESIGFFIKNNNGDERLVYITDTAFIHERFAGLTHIMIECNYDLETLNRVCDNEYKLKRIIATHFGLDQVVEFFNANALHRLREVRLLHLSRENSNEGRIIQAVNKILPPGTLLAACDE